MPEPEPQQTSAPAVEAPAAEQPKPLSPLLEAIKKPIPGGNPCGQEIGNADEDLQQIKDEINRIGAVGGKIDHEAAMAAAQAAKEMTNARLREMAKTGQVAETHRITSAAGGVNYALIIDLSMKILTEKSKDLRAAAYLSFALWKTQRFAGLAEGLAAINIVMQDFGECMYPPKTRATARKGAIEFFTQKLADDLKELDTPQLSPDDAPALQSAQEAMKELQKAFTSQQMPPQWESMLTGLAVAVESCVAKIPKQVKQTLQPTPGGGATEPAGGITPPSPPGKINSSQAASDAIRDAAKFWREQDRKNAASYRLLRSMKWDALVTEPGNSNGKTQMPAPREQDRKRLNTLQQNAQWEQLLNEGEASFTQPGFHVWLDLQRLLVAAMDALGGEYQHARMAILQELAILLQRVPKLPNLTFSDGTRFADPATQSWIEETVATVLGGEVSASGSSAAELESHVASLFDEAKKLAAKGDLAAAIAYLQEGAAIDTSGKNRFRRRLYMAVLCLRGGQPKMARPLLEDLSEEIDKLSLASWEPALALEVWRSLYDCYGALTASAPTAGKAVLQEQADRVFEKLCRLDLSFALAIAGTKAKTKRPALPKVVKTKSADGGDETVAEDTDEREAAASGDGKAKTDGKVGVEKAAKTVEAGK